MYSFQASSDPTDFQSYKVRFHSSLLLLPMHFICFYSVFIPGILWPHWYGSRIGDSRRRWFLGCTGVDLGERFWFGSSNWIWKHVDHWIRFLSLQSLNNSKDWPSRLSSVQKRQSGMSRHVAAAIFFVFSSICFVFFKSNCVWEGVWWGGDFLWIGTILPVLKDI